MKRFLSCLNLVGVLLFTTGIAQGAAVGNGSAPCQFYPSLAVGNGSSCNVPFYYQSVGTVGAFTSSANNAMPGQMSNLALGDDPNFNPLLFAVSEGLSSTHIEPNVGTYNLNTGITTTGVNLHTLCTGASPHEAGGVWQLGLGYVGVNACAFSAPIACMNSSTGGIGTTGKCDVLNIGDCVSCGGVSNQDLTSSGSQHPFANDFSESTQAKYGNTLLVGGQMQNGYGFASPGGTFSYTALSLNGSQPSGYDACAQGGSVTLQNLQTTSANAICNMAQYISNLASDGDLETIQFSSTVNGNVLSITLPTTGTFNGTTCTYTMTGTAATDATNIVNGINNGTLSGTGCSSTGNRWVAYNVANTTLCAASCVMVTLATGNPNVLTYTAPTIAQGSGGSLGTISAVQRNCTSGCSLSEHYQYGGLRLLVDKTGAPHWYAVIGNEYSASYKTGQPSQAGGYDINLAVACTNGVNADGSITWYDATCGKDSFAGITVSPATGANQRATASLGNAFGSGPGGSCTSATSPCTEYYDDVHTANNYYLVRPCASYPTGFPHFVYDYGQGSSGQNTQTNAILYAVKDVTLDANGNLGIAFEYANASNAVNVAYLTVSTTTDNNIQCTVVDSSNASVNAYGTLALTTSPIGTLVIDEAVGKPTYSVVTGTGTSIIRRISTNNGASWSSSIIKNFAGSNTNGQVCNIYDTIDGEHIYNLCMPGFGTAGSTSIYLFDEYTGVL